MKPLKILIFVFFVFSFLMVLSIFFPSKGIRLSPNLTLSFPDISNIDSTRKTESFDFYSILSHEVVPVKWKSEIKIEDKNNNVEQSSEPETKKEVIKESGIIIQDEIDFSSLLNESFPIEYGNSGTNELDNFFKSLQISLASDQRTRIIHYGDSQIEEGRISRTLRNNFQKRFGGKGSGLFPLKHINNNSLSILRSFSKNWQTFSLFNESQAYLRKSGFGVLTEFSRFEPVSFKSDGKAIRGAWLKISQIENNSANIAFDRLQLFLSDVSSPLIVELFVNNSFKGVKSISSNRSLQALTWNFDSPPNNIQINFRGNKSPDIYGLSLEGSSGVVLDNIALRGSSGLGFSNMNTALIKSMHEMMNVKLIIFQFGINLVRGQLNDYSGYEEELYNQLSNLRNISPDVSILVIGLSDMSKKINGRYES